MFKTVTRLFVKSSRHAQPVKPPLGLSALDARDCPAVLVVHMPVAVAPSLVHSAVPVSGSLDPQPLPPGAKVSERPTVHSPGWGDPVSLDPQPLPPGGKVKLDPQPLPPGSRASLDPQPLPPGGGKVMINPRALTALHTATTVRPVAIAPSSFVFHGVMVG